MAAPDEEDARGGLCWGLCKLFCCPPIPNHIVAKFAFLPPRPSYLFRDNPNGGRSLVLLDELGGDPVILTPPGKLHLLNIRTRRGNTIAGYFLETPDATFTVVFSHGNAVDIGQMATFLTGLAQQFKCNMMAYDYSGYGLSTGRPREANLYADIRAAVDTVVNSFSVPLRRIVLYGQSIGTVPTVDFASRNEVAGVILHSPLASGIRVLSPSTQRTWCCDPFPSIEKIHRIRCPTLIMHGTQDEVIHITHAHQLHEECPGSVEPLWVPGGGHNDLELHSVYLDRLTTFFEELSVTVATQES